MYNWDKLAKPWVYGSRGGTTDADATDLGGAGGGRIAVTVEDVLLLAGTIEANGGSVANEGGGGSGGSVMVTAQQMWVALAFPFCLNFLKKWREQFFIELIKGGNSGT
jgi:hypothetical protein